MKTKLLLFALLLTASTSLSWAQTAPTAPTITGVATDSQLSVAFTAGSDGGSAITGYKYSTDGGTTWLTRQTGTTASPIIITTLSSDGTTKIVSGTSYNIQIKAVNAIGDGDASTTSSATYLFLGGGAGTAGSPYLIGTPNDLNAAKTAINAAGGTGAGAAYYKLTADIDCSTLASGLFNGGLGVSAANPFSGTFDGSGHKITGLVDASALPASTTTRHIYGVHGFFNLINGATITNLWVDVLYYGTATASNYGVASMGGLVSSTTGSGNNIINNCKVTGTLDMEVTGASTNTKSSLGGMVGIMNSTGTTTIINSTVNVSVTARSNTTVAGSAIAGGIVGEVRDQTLVVNIVNCSAAGSVTSISALGDSRAGGILSFSYALKPVVNVLNCLATNTISSTGVSASGSNGTPAAGIGQLPTSGSQIKYCIALNPSIVGVNTAVSSTGTQALNRVFSINTPTAGNADFNYAKSDMTVQGSVNGSALTDITLSLKTKDGKDGADLNNVDPVGDATSKLNAYVSSNSSFNSIVLTTWTGGGLTTISANPWIVLKSLDYNVVNNILSVNGMEGTKELSIYSISGELIKHSKVTNSYNTHLVNGIYILKVDGYAPSKLVIY